MSFTVADEERSDLICTYAALILNDDQAPITAENIKKIVEAAGCDVEDYYPKLFASVLEGKDISSVLFGASESSSGSSSSGSSSSGSSSSGSSSDSSSDSDSD